MTTRAERTGRGLVAAAIATFTAVASHSLADGRVAPLPGVLLTLAFAVPLCIALSGRRRSWARLALAVGMSQFVFHGLLALGMGAFRTAAVSHSHHGAMAMVETTSAAQPHAHAAMWWAHAAAAVLTVLALGLGQRCSDALARLFGWRRLALLLGWVPAQHTRSTRGIAAWRFTSPKLALLTEMRRRGPPLTA
ncbi:MAG: hypothetical protein J0H64_04475 [Actinobacteria bacterium]|nr:hypothetical protein [Actinomycetota bacterium]